MKKIVACMLLMGLLVSQAQAEPYKVIKKSSLVLRAPDDSEPTIATLKRGKLFDGDRLGEWVRIHLDNDQQGFVHLADLKPLPVSSPDQGGSESKATIKERTRIRKAANTSSPAYRYLEIGEPVVIKSKSGDWVNVETQWKFDTGKPMQGYVLATALGLECMSGVARGIAAATASPIGVLSLQASNSKSVETSGIPADAYQMKDKNIKLESDLATIKKQLAGKLIEQSNLIESLEQNISKKEGELKRTQFERDAAVEESRKLTASLGFQIGSALVSGAEQVMLRGLGQVTITNLNNDVLIFVPISLKNQSDRLLGGVAKKIVLQGQTLTAYAISKSLLAQ